MNGANAFRSALSIDGSEDKTYNAVFQTTGVGLGATYYLMPANIYASAGVGAGWLYTTAYARVDDNFVLTRTSRATSGPQSRWLSAKNSGCRPALDRQSGVASARLGGCSFGLGSRAMLSSSQHSEVKTCGSAKTPCSLVARSPAFTA